MNSSEYYILDVLENNDWNSNVNQVDHLIKKKFVLLVKKEIDNGYNSKEELVSSGISFTIFGLLRFDSSGVHKCCGSSSFKWNASIDFNRPPAKVQSML